MADAVMFVYRGRQQATTFADVPADHWAYQDIEALYQNGFVVGCQAEPMRLFCPQATLSRAEAAVLVVRGVRGADFTPPQPLQSPFEDVALGDWYVDWVSQLWQDGYTAGCWAAPRRYCPLAGHTRAEATVFFTRMLKGPGYVPAGGGDLPYTDVPADAWYRKWVEAAYAQGVIGACEPPAERGDDLFRPEDPLSRAEAACMMARAKGLP
jgi:N-acetylmuramoyl-L-alanine amidase